MASRPTQAPVAPPHSAHHAHDIPSLDGLRAVSIVIVILSHARHLLPAAVTGSGLYRYVIGGGLHGVEIFFVISGYLITTLLCREFDRAGIISLRRFYLRRALRIFPPFYVYLCVLALLWIAGIVPQHMPTFLAAATYAIVYLPHPQGWYLFHAWSLSIEEQFYLLWPALLLLGLRRAKSTRWPVLLLILLPVARVFLFLHASDPTDAPSRLLVLGSSIDMLMVGCLFALLENDDTTQAHLRRWLNVWTTAFLCGIVLILVPYITAKLTHGVAAAIIVAAGYSLTALCIGGVLHFCIHNAGSISGRLLNWAPVRHVGLVSYSLYLWQQAFTAEPSRFGWLSFVLMLLAAELSYWMVEKPIQRFRSRFRIANAARISRA